MTVDLATTRKQTTTVGVANRSVDVRDEPSLDAVFSGVFWTRLFVLIFLVNFSMFFRGCAFEKTQFTCGFPAPICEISVSEQRSDHQIRKLSGVAVGTNILFATLCGFLLSISVRLRDFFYHRRTIAAVAFTFLAFNIALIWPWLWVNTTFAFETWLLELTLGNERRIWVLDIFSRCYFVFLALLAWVSIRLSELGWKRFVSKPNGKWWQFQLGGVFIVTTVACVIVALVVMMARK